MVTRACVSSHVEVKLDARFDACYAYFKALQNKERYPILLSLIHLPAPPRHLDMLDKEEKKGELALLGY